jgi:hypothetical protein
MIFPCSRMIKVIRRSSSGHVGSLSPLQYSRGVIEFRSVERDGERCYDLRWLMNVFYLHPDTDVVDEARRSPVYIDFRVRSIATSKDSIDKSTKRFACYKIICDRHILLSFLEAFPSAKVIWSYRGATDNANSALKRWPHATRAIRLVCGARSREARAGAPAPL